MRKPAIALLCGLVVAAAAGLAWYFTSDKTVEARPDPIEAAPLSAPPASAAPLQPSLPAAPASTASSPRAPKPNRDTPFALSSEHRALVQDAVLASSDLQKLEHEPRDNEWATEAERLIRSELARHASGASFDLVAVDCRSSLCAIQAFSYGEEGNRQWVKALDDVYRQTLVDSFDAINTAFPTQGGRAAVLTFLHRKPPPLTGR